MQRALFYFLTEQWDKYEQLDFDQTLLKRIYPHLDAGIRKRLTACARKAGRVELIEVVVDAHHQKKQLAEMTDKDWEAALSILSSRQAWHAIWRLTQIAPAVWSVRLLNKLRDGQWTPELDAERAVFEHIGGLAESCQREHIEHLSRYVGCSAVLQKQAGRIMSLAMSPDGRLLASSGCPDISDCPDIMVWLWRLPEGKAIQALEGHTSWVGCLAMSPDGQLLASGDRDGTVRLWRLPEGEAVQTLKGHTNVITCLAISSDSQRLISSDSDGTVRLWRLPEGEAVQALKGHTDYVSCLAMSPDGRLLASSSRDRTVRLWRLPEGEAVQTLRGHTDLITCLVMSPDGRLLASGSEDGTVRLWQSTLERLTTVPVGQITQQDMAWLENTLQSPDLTAGERVWLELTLELSRWHRRYDIELGEAPRHIPAGAFDIEIA